MYSPCATPETAFARCVVAVTGDVRIRTGSDIPELLQNRYLPQHSMAEIEQTAENDVIEALPLSA
ncbi:hypothetical protein EWM60_18300 [Candidatus Erwinia dacicola]|nr:hypothetical protein [Candidatus Erwinia dacicola]